MNIQDQLHKVFPVPQNDVIGFINNEQEPVEDRLYVAEAHARFFAHLKNCATAGIARHKNIDSNTEIMAAIMANDVQKLITQ